MALPPAPLLLGRMLVQGATVGAAMSEQSEQEALFEFCERFRERIPELQWAFHVPNGGARHPAVAAQLKAAGVKRGVPDVFMPIARYDVGLNVTYAGVVIEMKYGKNKTSNEQKAWLGFLARQGWQTHISYSWTEAARILVTYLGYDAKEFGL